MTIHVLFLVISTEGHISAPHAPAGFLQEAAHHHPGTAPQLFFLGLRSGHLANAATWDGECSVFKGLKPHGALRIYRAQVWATTKWWTPAWQCSGKLC